jgi:NitT/TauT family transport system substrate-binding protein
MRRRDLLGAISLACLPSAAVADVAAANQDRPPRDMTLVSSGGLSPASVELMYGVTGGYFAAQGLATQLIALRSGSAAIAALISGRADLIRANGLDIARAVARQNVDLVAIGTLTRAPGFVLISESGRPVRDAASLAGARIGIEAVAGTTDAFLDLLLRDAGLSPESVTRQTVGATAATFDLIALGRLDAAVMSYSVATEVQRERPTAVTWRDDAAVMLPGRCLVATRRRVLEEPDYLAAALRAIGESMREMVKNGPGGAVASAASAYTLFGGRDLAAFIAATANEMTLWTQDASGPTLRHDHAAWVAGCAKLEAAGLGHVADPTSLATDAVLDQL